MGSRPATWRRSSTVRSRCSSAISNAPRPPRSSIHAQPGPLRAGSRHIPAVVRRAVWRRDQGRCAFVGTHGRCAERGFLEFHHVQPHTAGGPASIENIQLRCRAHNIHEAEQYFHSRLPLLAREVASPYSVQTESAALRTNIHANISRPHTCTVGTTVSTTGTQNCVEIRCSVTSWVSSLLRDRRSLFAVTDRGRVRFNLVLSVIAAAAQVWTFTTVHNPFRGPQWAFGSMMLGMFLGIVSFVFSAASLVRLEDYRLASAVSLMLARLALFWPFVVAVPLRGWRLSSSGLYRSAVRASRSR